jgi:hypothetical protein
LDLQTAIDGIGQLSSRQGHLGDRAALPEQIAMGPLSP